MSSIQLLRIMTIVLIGFLSVSSVYGKIEEIRFHGAEFVELELTNSSVLDGAGIWKPDEQGVNNIRARNLSDTHRVIIAGENFYDEEVLVSGCSYFITERTQVAKGGLDDEGESFGINLTNGSTILISLNDTYTVASHQSLALVEGEFRVMNSSPCQTTEETEQEKQSENETQHGEDSFEDQKETLVCDEEAFVINVSSPMFNDSLEFGLSMPDNGSVSYWVEDGNGFTVKDPVSSTVVGKKQFTPAVDRFERYRIVANFSRGACQSLKKLQVVQVPNADTLSCGRYFRIESPKTFDERLRFGFDAELSNTTVTYWIESLNGSLLSERKQTRSLSTKQFTPDEEDYAPWYRIRANFSASGCSSAQSRFVRFAGGKRSQEEKETVGASSVFTIKEDIGSDWLDLDIRYGPHKESLHIGTEEQAFLRILPDGGEMGIKLSLPNQPLSGKRLLLQRGNESRELLVPKQEIPPVGTTRISLMGAYVNATKVGIWLNGSLWDKEGICYARHHRSLVSEEVQLSNHSGPLWVGINETALKESGKAFAYPLTLYCKYRKQEQVTYRYASQLLNYTLSEPWEETREGGGFIRENNATPVIVESKAIPYISEDTLLQQYSPYSLAIGATLLLGSVFVS